MPETPRAAAPAAALLLALGAAGCALFRAGLPESPVVSDAHRSQIIQAAAAAEADIQESRQLLSEDRVVDSLNLLLDRIKTLQTLLYDELILKSRAYDAVDLPAAREYGGLIGELRRAEDGLVQSLNEPLNRILNDILIRNPDPRRREEAVDAIDGGANEVFIQFKTGYREEIVRSFRVRIRTERNVAVKVKMAAVVRNLAVGPVERAEAAEVLGKPLDEL